MKKRRPATISLSAEVLDVLTPDGRGKRVDAVFTNGTGKKRRRIEVVTDPRPEKAKDPQK